MSTQVRTVSSNGIVNAVIAALIGSILIDLYLIVVVHETIPSMYQAIASTAFGRVAMSTPSYAAVGIVMHLITSLFWTFAYLYVWRTINSLSNWIVGGLVWGVVVAVCMTIVLALRGVPPDFVPMDVIVNLIGHSVFFGLPVAWYISRSVRSAG